DGAPRSGAIEEREESFAGCGFLGVVRERKRFGGKPRFEVPAHRRPGKIVNARGNAVRGKNGEAFARGVDEGHHHAFERRVAIAFPSAGAAYVAVSKGRSVAVVAGGSAKLLLGHGARHF